MSEYDIERLRSQADAGDPESCNRLGWLLLESAPPSSPWNPSPAGRTTAFIRATHYFRKSALGGDPEGMYNLGWRYFNREGIALGDGDDYWQDSAAAGSAAASWWLKAAELGHREALRSLARNSVEFNRDPEKTNRIGELLLKLAPPPALEGPSDPEQEVIRNEMLRGAFRYFERSASLNNPEGMWNLGWRYQLGEGVKASEERARLVWAQAAAHGHTPAREKLASLGLPVPAMLEVKRKVERYIPAKATSAGKAMRATGRRNTDPRLNERYNEIIHKYALLAAGVGIPGSVLPPLDIMGMTYVWISMIREVAEASGHPVGAMRAAKFAFSTARGLALYLGGSKLINALLGAAFPGAGTAAVAIINAAFNWIYTLRLGKFLAIQFSSPKFHLGSLMTLSASAITILSELPSAEEMGEAKSVLAEHFAGTDGADVSGEFDAFDQTGFEDLTTPDGYFYDDFVEAEGVVFADVPPSTEQFTVLPDWPEAWGDGPGLIAEYGGSSVRFSGFTHVDSIADPQGKLPICGYEAVENFAQLDHPSLTNSFSDQLQAYLGQGVPLDPNLYKPILDATGTPVEWFEFNPGHVAESLDAHRGVLLIGDAHALDPLHYPIPRSYHAFILTDVVRDDANFVVGFKGLDSNNVWKETTWPLERVIEAADNAGPWRNSSLHSLRPLRWPYT